MGRGYDVAIPVFVPESTKKWGTIRLGLSLQRAFRQIAHTRWTLGGLSVGAGGCGMLLAIGLAIRVTRSVEQLVGGVQACAHGEYDQRLAVDSRDELGYLAAIFDQMRASLQHHLAGGGATSPARGGSIPKVEMD